MTKEIIEKRINLLLGAIILFGAVIRIYLFNLVKTQAHWWDSLAYGSLAKNMIFHKWDEVPFIVHELVIRPPLFPLIWSWFLRMGASDSSLIFITGIVPSIISIFLVYLIGKEMYNAKIGLIAASFASVSWIHLFYSARAMTDVPSMCLVLASIYFFIKAQDSISIKPWVISILSLSFAVLLRYSHAVVAFAYLAFLISTHRTKLIKNKNFWIGGLIGAIPLIIFVLINLVNYGSLLPAGSEYSSSISENNQALAWYTIGFIKHILQEPLIYLFYLGFILIVIKTTMSYGFILKQKETKMHLFNILLLLFVLSFYIFIIKASEDRYLLGLSSLLFILPAITISYIYDFTSKYKKEIASVLCIALVLWSAYAQFSFAKSLMLDKKESYRQMKDAYEWIKYNTPEDSIIIGDWGEPYIIYYADRDIQNWPDNLTFTNFTLKADYVVLTAVHQPNEKVVTYVNGLAEKGNLVVVKAFFFDAEQKQPAVVIYKKTQ